MDFTFFPPVDGYVKSIDKCKKFTLEISMYKILQHLLADVSNRVVWLANTEHNMANIVSEQMKYFK
jgi:hypothetical protein